MWKPLWLSSFFGLPLCLGMKGVSISLWNVHGLLRGAESSFCFPLSWFVTSQVRARRSLKSSSASRAHLRQENDFPGSERSLRRPSGLDDSPRTFTGVSVERGYSRFDLKQDPSQGCLSEHFGARGYRRVATEFKRHFLSTVSPIIRARWLFHSLSRPIAQHRTASNGRGGEHSKVWQWMCPKVQISKHVKNYSVTSAAERSLSVCNVPIIVMNAGHCSRDSRL